MTTCPECHLYHRGLFTYLLAITLHDPSMPTETGTQNPPCHTTRSSTMRRLKKKHRHERRFQPSRETYMEMERPRREDGQQQMDTQAHHVGLQRRQKERGATTDEMGWPAEKTCGRPMVQKCERQSVVERTWKNFHSIGLAPYRAHTSYALL